MMLLLFLRLLVLLTFINVNTTVIIMESYYQSALRSEERISRMLAEETELVNRHRNSSLEAMVELRRMAREMTQKIKSQDVLLQSARVR